MTIAVNAEPTKAAMISTMVGGGVDPAYLLRRRNTPTAKLE
jgi:hypothetical protein